MELISNFRRIGFIPPVLCIDEIPTDGNCRTSKDEDEDGFLGGKPRRARLVALLGEMGCFRLDLGLEVDDEEEEEVDIDGGMKSSSLSLSLSPRPELDDDEDEEDNPRDGVDVEDCFFLLCVNDPLIKPGSFLDIAMEEDGLIFRH